MTKKVTKAEKVRIILRRDLGKKTEDEIIKAVMKMAGFKRGLATAYVNNNIPVVQAEKKTKKKASKKRVSKKRK